MRLWFAGIAITNRIEISYDAEPRAPEWMPDVPFCLRWRALGPAPLIASVPRVEDSRASPRTHRQSSTLSLLTQSTANPVNPVNPVKKHTTTLQRSHALTLQRSD